MQRPSHRDQPGLVREGLKPDPQSGPDNVSRRCDRTLFAHSRHDLVGRGLFFWQATDLQPAATAHRLGRHPAPPVVCLCRT